MSANVIQPKNEMKEIPEVNESMMGSNAFPSMNEEAKMDDKISKVMVERVDSEEDVRSCEDLDSDELDGDLNLSGEEDNSHVQQMRVQSKA